MDRKKQGKVIDPEATKLLSKLIANDPFASVDKSNQETQDRLLKVSILCVFFMVMELIGGYISNSLAIMSDAAHLLSDLLSFFVSIFALKLSQQGINRNYTFGYHRAEVLGALGSIAIIWVLTGWLLVEAFNRFISPPEEFSPLAMMMTAFLGILVNLVMGFTLNQSGHKHFHSHLMGGSCSHDHGSAHSGPAHGDYELMDLEVKGKAMPLRSKSMEIKCERNFEHNEHHHHHQRAELVDCCDLENCNETGNPQKIAAFKPTTTIDGASLKKEHNHVHGPGGCNGHHDEEDHKHDDHKHDDHDHKHEHGPGGCAGHDHKKETKHNHGHDHEHGPGGCSGHDHKHEPKAEKKAEHKHDDKCDHKHDDKHDHGHGGHGHDHGHDHKHDGHDHCHGHNHFHDHDAGSNYEIDGMNVNLRAAFIHIVGDLIQSIGVFIVAVIIWFKPNALWIDPLCTVLFSIIVIFTTVPVSKECVRVLMEATPVKLDVKHLAAQIEQIPGVIGTFEVRIWMINESRNAMSAKLLVDRYSSKIVSQVKTICADYKIFNSTVELKVYESK